MKKTSCLFLILLFSFFAFSQESNPFTGSLLWKISGNDLKKPSYILGTHHAVPSSFLENSPEIKTAFKKTKQVVGELDLSNMEALQLQLLQHSIMPEGTTYKSLLSEEDYTFLDSALIKWTGSGLDQLGMLHPAVIQSFLIEIMCAQIFPEMNQTDYEGVDFYIQRLAMEKKKPIIELETPDEQIQLLYYSSPLKEQAESLVCEFRNMEHNMSLMLLLTQDYLKGDLEKLEELAFTDNSSETSCSGAFSKNEEDMITHNRNAKWLQKLPGIMRNKPSLIVVGALHLTGGTGILYQLDVMGYRVEGVW